jgi:hypothetical protein
MSEEIARLIWEIARRLLNASKLLAREELSPDDVAVICFAESARLRELAEKLRD